MNGAVVVRWGATVPGREGKSLEVFGAAIERFEGLAKEGRIHGHHEYIALTGDAGGFMIADGEVAELQKILVEPETLALNSKAGAICEDFSINLFAGGSDASIQELIGTYMSSMGEMGYL